MKRISVTFGRMGAVLLAVCAALAILTLIPPATTSSGSGTFYPPLPSGKFSLKSMPFQLNPQITLKVEVNTNSTIGFCIVSSPRQAELEYRTGNLSELEEFLDENECEIVENVTVHAGAVTSLEFTPSGLLNASFLVVNRSPYAAQISYEVALLVSIAPKVRIIPVITYMSPVGAILVGQWVFIEFKNRKREF